MSKQAYIYRVSFKEPTKSATPQKDDWGKVERTDYFFGSLSAIYDMFSAEQVGFKVSRLWTLKITPENPYIGRRCTITKEPLECKKHNSQ